jgi:hypothetical protein
LPTSGNAGCGAEYSKPRLKELTASFQIGKFWIEIAGIQETIRIEPRYGFKRRGTSCLVGQHLNSR